MVADLTLDKAMLKAKARGKLVTLRPRGAYTVKL